MGKAANKTQPSEQSVSAFLATIDNPKRVADAKAFMKLMRSLTRTRPVMWGSSMVGYGKYRYTRADKSEHEFFVCGFSPRAQYLAIYILPGYEDFSAELAQLGPHKKGRSCLNVKDYQALDETVLAAMVLRSAELMRARYPGTRI